LDLQTLILPVLEPAAGVSNRGEPSRTINLRWWRLNSSLSVGEELAFSPKTHAPCCGHDSLVVERWHRRKAKVPESGSLYGFKHQGRGVNQGRLWREIG